MARKSRLSPNQLAELKASFAGLKTISGYAPVKAEFKVSEITLVETAIDTLTEQELRLLTQIADLRAQIADKGAQFQAKMKGAAQQVIAQYGDDSPEIQALGRKRLSDRATRKPNKPAKPTT